MSSRNRFNMEVLHISLLAFMFLFQGIWAKPKTAVGELYHYSMQSGKLSLQETLDKVTGQADEECKCVAHIYEHPDYRGRNLTLRQQNANFGNDYFHDRADSIKIDGNCNWIFYEHCNFKGSAHLVRMGTYSSAPRWGGRTDRISSARALPPQGTQAIALFEHRNYQGRMVVLEYSNGHLPSIEFNDKISSFIITGGTWEIYEHPNFRGRFVRLAGERECRNIHNKVRFGGDSISSVRKVDGARLKAMEKTESEESQNEDWNDDY